MKIKITNAYQSLSIISLMLFVSFSCSCVLLSESKTEQKPKIEYTTTTKLDDDLFYYSLVIKNGRISIKREAPGDPDITGTISRELSIEELDQIFGEIKKSNFLDWKDEYGKSGSITNTKRSITIRFNGKSKTVVFGKEYPIDIKNFLDKISSIVKLSNTKK